MDDDDHNDSQVWPPKPDHNAHDVNKAPFSKHEPAGVSFLLGLLSYVGSWFLMWFWDEMYGTSIFTVKQFVWFGWLAVFAPYPLLLIHKILFRKPWKDYRPCFLGFTLGTIGAVVFYFQLSQGGVL